MPRRDHPELHEAVAERDQDWSSDSHPNCALRKYLCVVTGAWREGGRTCEQAIKQLVRCLI